METKKKNKIVDLLIIITACIIGVFVCCGLYDAFTFIFELYLSKFSLSFADSTVSLAGQHIFSVPALVASVVSYPFAVLITAAILSIIVKGASYFKLKDAFSSVRVKKLPKAILILFVNIIFAASVGTGLLWAAYALPSGNTSRNMEKSAGVFASEGPRPSVVSWATSILDNYTDSLILLTVSDETDGPLLENALMNHHGVIHGSEPVETLVKHFSDGAGFDDHSAYPRYWHGYNIVLKPLLRSMGYKEIRTFNTLLQVILVTLICFSMARRERKNLIIPFLLTYLMLMPAAMGRSLQYSSCFYAALLSVFVLLLKRQDRGVRFLFLYTGIATAFFDLLTFPVMTFGFPAAVYLSLIRDRSSEDRLIDTVRNGISWCLGYGCMWASKWLIADLVTGSSDRRDAIDTIGLRTSAAETVDAVKISVFSVIGRNLLAFFFTPATVFIAFYILFLFFRNRRCGRSTSADTAFMLPHALLLLLPFFWYSFAANHSMLHFWFTNKALSVAVLSIMCGISDISAVKKTHLN